MATETPAETPAENATAHAGYGVVGVTEDTRADFVQVDRLTWFDEEDPAEPDWSRCLDLSRAFAATETGGPPFAGIYGSFDMTITVPAPEDSVAPAPMAGLTWVGVHPDHRRRGVLTAMLDHHFRDLHERGEVLAGLHASETGIYGRFGYAVAATDAIVEVGRGADVRAPGVDTTGIATRLATLSDEGMARQVWELHRDLAATTLGQVVRPWRLAELVYTDRAASLRGAEKSRVLFAEREGRPAGYALLRRTPKWHDGGPRGRLDCWEVAAAEPAVLLALLRRLVSFDLLATIQIRGLPADSPAIWWLGGPRSCLKHTYDGVWLRPIDVRSCLELRGYAGETDLVLDVADERCSWNARRWRLSTSADGRAKCAPTSDPADLSVEVQAVGALFTGGRTPGALAQQGLASEHRRGALAALAAVVATPVAPNPGVGF